MSSQWLRAVVLAAAVVALGVGAAPALADQSDVATVKAATRDVDRAWAQSKVDEQSAVSVQIRKRSGGGATLTDRAGRRLGVSVAGARSGGELHAAGGTTVFDQSLGKTVDTAVQRTETGVRMLAVIGSADAPSVYRYPLRLPRGATLDRQRSGAVLIRGAKGRIIGAVRVPWARDATGQSVPTRLDVRGTTLVQHVDHRGAAYPVVADPSIDFGWTSATITLNPKDQRIILSAGGTAAGGLLGALICSGSGPGAALCAVGGATIGTLVFEAIKEYAVDDNCDVKVVFGYFPPEVDQVYRVCH
jgi:hypothetical protein